MARTLITCAQGKWGQPQGGGASVTVMAGDEQDSSEPGAELKRL